MRLSFGLRAILLAVGVAAVTATAVAKAEPMLFLAAAVVLSGGLVAEAIRGK